MRAALALVAALLLPVAAMAQETEFRVLDLEFRTVDLEFRTLDLLIEETEVAGATTDLAVEETETEIRISLAADVLFDFDSSDIRTEAAVALGQVAALLREHPDQPVRIEGHTDFERLRRLQPGALGGTRLFGARVAGRPRKYRRREFRDRRLRRDAAGRAERASRWVRRSRWPPEEPSRRDRDRQVGQGGALRALTTVNHRPASARFVT